MHVYACVCMCEHVCVCMKHVHAYTLIYIKGFIKRIVSCYCEDEEVPPEAVTQAEADGNQAQALLL